MTAWHTKKLGDVLEVQNGYAFDSKGFNSEYGIPLIRIRSLKAGTETETRYAGDYESKYVVSAGDLLVGMDGEFGCYEWKGEPALLNQRVCRLRGFSGELVPRFLFYGVNDFLKAIEDVTGFTTVKHLSSKQIICIEFPIPPLAEQHRIIRILDEAFENIAVATANTQKNLKNARAVFESYLESILLNSRWNWKTLGDLCDRVEYGTSAKSKAMGGVAVLRMGNIQNGKLDWKNLAYSDDEAEINKYLLEHDDVLFNRTNSPELVGKTGIYKSEMPAIFAGYLIRIHRKKNLLDADFLNYFLNSQIALDYGKTVTISSVNQANINGTKLRGYPIPAIPLAAQREIVANLNAISFDTQRLETIYKQKLDSLEALKKSLLHQAFSGEL
ncbi:MAG: restriction endonuclease subunit S [bacterium]|nr:restriction endonuclease subunit S [bacterium]